MKKILNENWKFKWKWMKYSVYQDWKSNWNQIEEAAILIKAWIEPINREELQLETLLKSQIEAKFDWKWRAAALWNYWRDRQRLLSAKSWLNEKWNATNKKVIILENWIRIEAKFKSKNKAKQIQSKNFPCPRLAVIGIRPAHLPVAHWAWSQRPLASRAARPSNWNDCYPASATARGMRN